MKCKVTNSKQSFASKECMYSISNVIDICRYMCVEFEIGSLELLSFVAWPIAMLLLLSNSCTTLATHQARLISRKNRKDKIEDKKHIISVRLHFESRMKDENCALFDHVDSSDLE